MTEGVLSMSDVEVSFGDVAVLSSVSLDIDTGEVVCLVGPNGSGKTTLLRVVSRLLDPDSGSVSVASAEGRAVGYLPQSPAFRPPFTVQETLAGYAALVETDESVEQRLATVGLDTVADRRIDALSGGMVRLLGLAQATVGDPPLLVLDEPASGLDPQMSRHIASVVTEIADEGTAVLLATHDLTAVERIADRVLLLDRGEFVASGAPDELCRSADVDSLADAVDTLVSRGETVTVRAGHPGEASRD